MIIQKTLPPPKGEENLNLKCWYKAGSPMTNGTVGLWKGFFCYSWLGEHKPTRWTYITGVIFFLNISFTEHVDKHYVGDDKPSDQKKSNDTLWLFNIAMENHHFQ